RARAGRRDDRDAVPAGGPPGCRRSEKAVTLLQRILVEKRPLLIPLAIAIIVNVAVYALVVYPLGAKQAGAQDRAKIAQQSLRVAEGEMAAARALVSGKGRAEQELA